MIRCCDQCFLISRFVPWSFIIWAQSNKFSYHLWLSDLSSRQDDFKPIWMFSLNACPPFVCQCNSVDLPCVINKYKCSLHHNEAQNLSKSSPSNNNKGFYGNWITLKILSLIISDHVCLFFCFKRLKEKDRRQDYTQVGLQLPVLLLISLNW